MGAGDQQGRLPARRKYLHYYIAGFVDAEGSFNVSLKPHSKMKYGWVVDPVFQVYQHKDNLVILEIIQEALNCGRIKPKSPTSNVMVYIVDNRRTLVEKIIPFFERYPLLSNKYYDFLKFKEILERMERKEHLNPKGLLEIVKIAVSMNASGKQRKYLYKDVEKSVKKIWLLRKFRTAAPSETVRRTH